MRGLNDICSHNTWKYHGHSATWKDETKEGSSYTEHLTSNTKDFCLGQVILQNSSILTDPRTVEIYFPEPTYVVFLHFFFLFTSTLHSATPSPMDYSWHRAQILLASSEKPSLCHWTLSFLSVPVTVSVCLFMALIIFLINLLAKRTVKLSFLNPRLENF